MIKKWNITYPAHTGEEQRSVYLYLPEFYDFDSGRRYPVLYMFDGHNVFFDSDATYGKSWGMKEYMDRTGTQMIIAAIECSHGENNERLSEYSPFDFSDPELGRFKGRGRETMDWLVNTFKPEIDRTYRTIPDRENTWIAGSSMGGLMSLYAVMEYNHIFAGAAALSPSVWVAPAKLSRLVRESKLYPRTTVYMDYGSDENGFYPKIQTQFAKIASSLMERRVLVTSRVVPGGTHCEACWERQIPFMISTLLYGRDQEGEAAHGN